MVYCENNHESKLENQVTYNGKEYIIIYDYNNGMVEVRNTKRRSEVELVHKSELIFIRQLKSS